MKLFIIFLISLGLVIDISAQKPETVYSVAKVLKPHDWYVKQAGLWWIETEKNKSDEEAWFNYFKACRMAKISAANPTDWKSAEWTKESPCLREGDEIIKLADQYIPDSFTANFIKFWNHGSDPEMFRYLKRAYELKPGSAEMYDDFISYYETQSDLDMRKRFNKEWFSLNDMSPGLLSLNYNSLNTAKSGSIIITGGDNDTYPAWMLQDVQGICSDIQVINLHLLNIEEYRNAVFKKNGVPKYSQSNNDGSTIENNTRILAHLLKNKPSDLNVYLSMFLWEGYYAGFKDQLFIVGNLLLYSEKPINNIALIEENFEKKYALDYLKFDVTNDVSKEIVNQMNFNYIPGLIKLFEYYKTTNQKDKAGNIRNIGLIIAAKAGKEWKEKALQSFKE